MDSIENQQQSAERMNRMADFFQSFCKMGAIFWKRPVKSVQNNILPIVDRLIVNIVKTVENHIIMPDQYSRQVCVAAGIFRMNVFPVRQLEQLLQFRRNRILKNSLIRLKHPRFKILIEVSPGDIHLIQ